jgi:tetratricopeptide (TPR) repeat protein
MRKSILFLFSIILFYGCEPKITDQPQEESFVKNGINWVGENEIANHMAWRGMHHYMNIEFPKALIFFEEAIRLDSSLFASHVILSFLSSGEISDHHKAMAEKFVVNENETSKIFVSILENRSDTTSEKIREKWAEMHGLSNGPFIHYYYALTRSDTLETISELDKLLAFCDEHGLNTGHIHNTKGYILKSLGRLNEGVAEIEKYLELYPDGYNPLDSRAEFYLFQGDTVNAIRYYEKVLERAPYSRRVRNLLENLKED